MSKIWLWAQRLTARRVGEDSFGNVYYESKKPDRRYGRTKRLVAIGGDGDATRVPPEWHGWLHHTSPEPVQRPNYPWLQPHQPSATGTPQAWRPRGHDYVGGQRRGTTGDYEAWTPGS